MATYKQRAPYHRHTVSSRLSDDDDGANPSSSHASYVSASHLTQHTSFHQSQHHGQHPQAHSQAYTTDDDFFDSASNLEWTSSRHSTSARAKARQQQYLDQQLQRTREWQSVLAQHRQTASQLPVLNTAPASGPAVVVQVATPLSATLPPTLPSTTETATIESKGSNVSAGPAVSSDEFEDDLLASSDLPSGLASPRTADFGTPGLGTSSHAEHLSTFGFSDLTSDGGMESVDESEDLGVWSHEDEDEDGPSPYTPSFRRLSAISLSSSTSSPLVLSSATASLSHLPRPSFALATASASPYTGVDLTKFQNQMPFHDGSGNFGVAGRRGMGAMSSVMDESEYFDSDSSRASSVLRAYRPGTPLLLRRRISSSEFQNVIRNIAELQQANDRQQFERYTIEMQQPPPQRPHFIYPQIVPRRPIFNIYESEMEDLEEMVDDEVPAKIGWLQAFEQTLRALHPNEYAVHVTDPTVINPIKALAYHYSREESSLPHKDTKQLTRSTDATIPSSSSSSSSSSSPSSDSDARTSKESPEAKGKGRGQEKTKAEEEEDIKASCRVEQIRQNMSSASLQSLQRLQERKRSSPDQSPGHQDLHPGHGRLNRSDPMQVDFCPTIQHPPSPALVGMTRKECRVLSKSTGTSTSHSVHDSNIIAVVISTLRRFRDHVKSNLLYPEFYDEYESNVPHHLQHQQQQQYQQQHQQHLYALQQQHQNDLSRSLGLDGDVGIEWSLRATAAGEQLLQQHHHHHHHHHQSQGSVVESEAPSRSHSRQQHRHGRPKSQHGHRSLSTSTSSSSLASINIRRVSSDCGLESMRKGLKYRHPHPRSAHESNALVE